MTIQLLRPLRNPPRALGGNNRKRYGIPVKKKLLCLSKACIKSVERFAAQHGYSYINQAFEDLIMIGLATVKAAKRKGKL